MRLADNELEISPILGVIENDLLGVPWTRVEPPRVVKLTSHVPVHHIGLYSCTNVQDPCSIAILYCCIT
jgi:hypothetical protein